MKKRILSFLFAVAMILSTLTGLGISSSAEAVTAAETADNVLHISNSDTDKSFWCDVSIPLDSAISEGYVEFYIRTERVGYESFMHLMLYSGKSYSNIAIQQNDGKYYFNKVAASGSNSPVHLKEIGLGEWHHVKLIIESSGVSVSIDGGPASADVNRSTSVGGESKPVDKIIFEIGHGEAAGCEVYVDNVRAAKSDGTVVYEQSFDGEAVGDCPSEVVTTVRDGYTLDNTTVSVVNAAPLLDEDKALHFVGESGAGDKSVTATYSFAEVTNADIEFDYTPIAMGTESKCRQGLIVGKAQIGVVLSAIRTGTISQEANNISSGVKTVTLGETYRFKLSVDETEGSKLYVNGQLCSGAGDSTLAAVKSVNKFEFYLDHVQDSQSEMKIDNIKITKHDTGEVIYSESFDKMISDAKPIGWTLDNKNEDKLAVLVSVNQPVTEEESGNINEDFDSIAAGSLPEGFRVSDGERARVETESLPSNVLHISNSDTDNKFWCDVSVLLDSAISEGYVEFDVRTERVGYRSFMHLMLYSGTSYGNIAIQQNEGEYYFSNVAKTDANSIVRLKEIELGEWHHVKLIIESSGVSVSIDGGPVSYDVNRGTAVGGESKPIDKIIFEIGHGEDAGCEVYIDNIKAVKSDGTVVYEQDLDGEAVGSCPSEVVTTVRDGYTLDNTTVSVTNAIPLLNEQKTLHFIGKSGAGDKSVTAAYSFDEVTNADIEFDYTPIAMPEEGNSRQGLWVGSAQIGVVNSAIRTGDISKQANNIGSGVTTVTLGETYRFKLSVDENEGSKLYVNGQLCSGAGNSALAEVKSVNKFEFYLDHVLNTESAMKIDNIKITEHGTGEVVYSESFDNMISGAMPKGWTVTNKNEDKLSVLVSGTTPIPRDGNILRIEDNTSEATVYTEMAIGQRSKAEIGLLYKTEKLTDGHIFAVKDGTGANKIVLRAVPLAEEKAKLQYLDEKGEYVDIEKSEFTVGEWNSLEITVYADYGKADLLLNGLELGEIYSDIGIDKFTSFEAASASVEGVADIFCIDSVSVTSENIPCKIPTASSMGESKTVAAGSSFDYDFGEVACSGRFTFVLSSSDLSDTVLSLADGEILGTQVKIGADGRLYYLRDSIWMEFTNFGVIDPDDGKAHTVILDVPLERNVGYTNVFVDGALVGTAFYNLSFEYITGLQVTAPAENDVTVSSLSVDASQGIFEIPKEEEKSVSPYYSEVISGTRGMYAIGDNGGTAAMKYFDDSDLETLTLDLYFNAIGIDLGSKQRVNTVRVRFKDIDTARINDTAGTDTMWNTMNIYVSDDNVKYTSIAPSTGTSRNTVNDGNDVIMSFDFSGVETRYIKIGYRRSKDSGGILTALADNTSISATRRITRQWAMAGDVVYKENDTAPISGAMIEVNDITAPITLVKNCSVGINFGLVSDVEAVELIGAAETLGANDFAVYYTVDNVTYEKIDVTSISRDTRNGQSVLRFNFNSIKATHLKINLVSDVSIALASAEKGIAAYSSIEASSSTTYVRGLVGRGSEGGFFTCDDGTLVMSHIEYDGTVHGDDAPAHISIRRSTDGGVTWTDSVTVVTKADETSLNVFVPTFVRLNDGRVGMVFMEKFASKDSAIYMITSDNEGETWSERQKIAQTDGDVGYFCLTSGSPAHRAPNGRVLVTFAFSVYEKEAYGSDRCYGYVVYSDDNGETWKRSKNSVTAPEGVMEPSLSATPDGKLIMTMTTRNIGHIYRSISEDNGETWSQPVPLQEEFKTSHLTQGHVLIPGKDQMVYICVNDQTGKDGPKTPLVSAITADNGESYHNIRHITEGAGATSVWPVVKIYGRKVIIQIGLNTMTIRTFDIAELYHSVTGDISALPKAVTPTAVYDEKTRTLSGVNTDTVYSLDGGESWIFAGGSSVTFEESLIQTARRILVKNIGNTEYAPSDIQSLEAHDFDGDTCTVCGATCTHKWTEGVCEYCGSGCKHVLEFNVYTGLYYCTVCGENCPHNWSDGTCTHCGLVCVHDWKYFDGTSICAVCEKTCTDHSKLGLDFNCAACGCDTGAENAFNKGASFLYDNYYTLESYHGASISFDLTVDNAYYDNSTKPTTTSDYHSLLALIRTANDSTEYHIFASLWMDKDSGKLYLTKAGKSDTKICEIELGEKYAVNIDLEPKGSGAYSVTVSSNGTVIGSLNGNFGGFGENVKPVQLRFGEAVNAKYLRVQKIGFENIEITTKPYSDGVCTDCGVECNHIYNIGGHCHICGVLGDPITFGDGKNGGGNIIETSKNGQPLTVGDGVYSQDNGGYRQCWDYRDTEGILLGQDYVFSGKFTFNEFTHEEVTTGDTRLLIWSDGDVNADNTKFTLLLYSSSADSSLKLGVSKTENMEILLGKEYDIRVAVRSLEESLGTYSNRAEVYVNGKLMWTRNFTLTSENGVSVRLGDHVMRTTRVKYGVKNDFGIHFLDSTIDYIGAQEKEDANYNYDTTFDLRFVLALDDLYLKDVGVKIEAAMTGGNLYEDAQGELTCSSSKTVLNNIMADGKIYKPAVNGAGGGGYYLALAVRDIPLDTSATYNFTLTPYVTYHGDEPVFSEASYKITVSFVGDKMNFGYGK